MRSFKEKEFRRGQIYFRFLIFLNLYFNTLFFLSAQYLPEARLNKDIFSPVSFLQEYVSVPSVSGDESDASALFSSTCRDHGLYVKDLKGSSDGSNFIASLYPLESGKPNIIFENHIDVVSAGNLENWHTNPFEGSLRDGKIYGRGAIDNKGLAVMQLSAILSFRAEASGSELPYNISILSVVGEETGGQRGSNIVAGEYSGDLNACVVIGEGACGIENLGFIQHDSPVFGISIAEKSILWIELLAESNNAGHSSIKQDDYPNKRLVKALHRILKKRQAIQFTGPSKLMFRELGKVVGGMKGFALKHFNWVIFRPVIKHYVKLKPELESLLCNTVTLSHLHNPEGDPNQLVQKASAVLDCRLLPGTSSEKMIKKIERKVKDTTVHVKILCQGPPSLISYPDEYFYTMASSIREVYPGAHVIPVLFPASSDNNYYRQIGVPTYGINPHKLSMEQIASIHNTDENIDAQEVRSGARVYKVFIQKMMSGKINP